MKILFACKEFPHAKIIGGPIIIYNRLKYLSKHYTVSLAAFINEDAKKFIPTVEPFCHDLKLVPLPKRRSFVKIAWDFFFSIVPPYFLRVHGSEEMARTIGEMVQKDKYDFVIAEYSVMGQFLYGNPFLPDVKRIISVHECYYLARLKEFRLHKIGWKKLKELFHLKGLKSYEFDMYRNADKILTLTPQGKEELSAIDPELKIDVVPHGVDVEKFSFPISESEKKNIVFVGNYLHFPNADAVMFFYREFWSILKSKLPNIRFEIVGQAPPQEIQDMARNENIIVTGKVDEVVPYLHNARVFICPVRLGGGFRGKILEAMSAGCPVVSTPLGAEGIPAIDRENIILAEKPDDFVQGIYDLFTDDSLYHKIRKNARDLIENKYAWKKGVEILAKVLEGMKEKT